MALSSFRHLMVWRWRHPSDGRLLAFHDGELSGKRPRTRSSAPEPVSAMPGKSRADRAGLEGFCGIKLGDGRKTSLRGRRINRQNPGLRPRRGALQICLLPLNRSLRRLQQGVRSQLCWRFTSGSAQQMLSSMGSKHRKFQDRKSLLKRRRLSAFCLGAKARRP